MSKKNASKRGEVVFNRNRLTLFISILFILTIAGIIIAKKEWGLFIVPTSSISNEADEKFFKLMNSDIILNSGIEVKTFSSTIRIISPQQDKADVSFFVLNHTDEPVIFLDQAFGVVIYFYETQNETWYKIDLLDQPGPYTTILPSNIENFSPEAKNYWRIRGKNFFQYSPGQIRIFVSGIGESTGTEYGSYTDIEIIR
jgi:hypothetical protein